MRNLKTMLLAGSLLLWNVPGVSAATISVQPTNTLAGVGGSFSVDINIASITDLYAYQFDLAFDPAIVSATGLTGGLFLSGGTGFVPGIIDNVAGTITFTADSLTGPVPGVSGSGTLATIQFSALAPGTSALTLSNLVFLDSLLLDIPIDTTNNGTVDVSGTGAVPEPSQFAPLLLTLLALRIRRCPRSLA